MCNKPVVVINGQAKVCIRDHKTGGHMYVNDFDAPPDQSWLEEIESKVMTLTQFSGLLGITCITTAIVGILVLGRG